MWNPIPQATIVWNPLRNFPTDKMFALFVDQRSGRNVRHFMTSVSGLKR